MGQKERSDDKDAVCASHYYLTCEAQLGRFWIWSSKRGFPFETTECGLSDLQLSCRAALSISCLSIVYHTRPSTKQEYKTYGYLRGYRVCLVYFSVYLFVLCCCELRPQLATLFCREAYQAEKLDLHKARWEYRRCAVNVLGDMRNWKLCNESCSASRRRLWRRLTGARSRMSL